MFIYTYTFGFHRERGSWKVRNDDRAGRAWNAHLAMYQNLPVALLSAYRPVNDSLAASTAFDTEDEVESLREEGWYITPWTFFEAQGPMFNT